MACAVRQQAITWANIDPDLCHHMAPLGPNDLNQSIIDSSNDLFHYIFIINSSPPSKQL